MLLWLYRYITSLAPPSIQNNCHLSSHGDNDTRQSHGMYSALQYQHRRQSDSDENVSGELTQRSPPPGNFLQYVSKVQAENATLTRALKQPSHAVVERSSLPTPSSEVARTTSKSAITVRLESTQTSTSTSTPTSHWTSSSAIQIAAASTPQPRSRHRLHHHRRRARHAPRSEDSDEEELSPRKNTLRRVRPRTSKSRCDSQENAFEVLSDAPTQDLPLTVSLSQSGSDLADDRATVHKHYGVSAGQRVLSSATHETTDQPHTVSRRTSIAKPPILYSHCQWKMWSRYLAFNDTRPENAAFSLFGLTHADQQAQCDNEDGLAQHGDLCKRHAKSLLGVYVEQSTAPGGGLGLFTSWARVFGERICEYTGVLRLQADTDANERATGAHTGMYAISLGRQPTSLGYEEGCHFVLDASRSTDGFARYANDFSKGQLKDVSQCNCVFRAGDDLIRDRQDWTRMYLESAAQISPGSELSVFYGVPYWS